MTDPAYYLLVSGGTSKTKEYYENIFRSHFVKTEKVAENLWNISVAFDTPETYEKFITTTLGIQTDLALMYKESVEEYREFFDEILNDEETNG